MADSNYGAIPSQNRPVKPVARAKLSVMAKVAPFLVLFCMVGLTLLSSKLDKDERMYDQDLYAIEQDDIYNKRLMWTGTQWVDETTGKPVKLSAPQQRTQQLLLTQVLAAKAAGGKAAHKNYECCLLDGKQGGHQALVEKGVHEVESGFYCHMAMKGLPSSKWPMIRMGSLREAGVTSDAGVGGSLLASGQIHLCNEGGSQFLKQVRSAREMKLSEVTPKMHR